MLVVGLIVVESVEGLNDGVNVSLFEEVVIGEIIIFDLFVFEEVGMLNDVVSSWLFAVGEVIVGLMIVVSWLVAEGILDDVGNVWLFAIEEVIVGEMLEFGFVFEKGTALKIGAEWTKSLVLVGFDNKKLSLFKLNEDCFRISEVKLELEDCPTWSLQCSGFKSNVILWLLKTEEITWLVAQFIKSWKCFKKSRPIIGIEICAIIKTHLTGFCKNSKATVISLDPNVGIGVPSADTKVIPCLWNSPTVLEQKLYGITEYELPESIRNSVFESKSLLKINELTVLCKRE